MVKIFVGNLSQSTTTDELRSLFSQYGKISECDIVKNYGFVHMTEKEEAEEAIRNLNQHVLNGLPMNVEMSKGKPRGSTKLHVSNISSTCTNQELRSKFEEFGPVMECDIVKDYAFVHMEHEEDAMEAIRTLDNSAFQGKLMNVQLSTSRLRTVPGMGDQTGCYVCGKQGHWSKHCNRGQNGSYGDDPGFHAGQGFPRGPPGFGTGPGFGGPGMPGAPTDYGANPMYGRMPGFPRAPLLPPMARYPSYGLARDFSGDQYGGRSSYEGVRYGSVDFYEKYRAYPYTASYGPERGLSVPPPTPLPSSSSVSRMQPSSSSGLDAFEHRPLPAAPSSTSSYFSRDRSPIRRVDTSSESYSYERTRLSPVSKTPAYPMTRTKDTYTDRAGFTY
ncbi:RNA-binding protein 4.1 isoform X3 [Denticeps clupeoides]|uniref:RNA-binding protein 4.1 isoform X3 n=1 Tax=Denticeps clupeoides TaxID=299321 RepID=UPI0010A3FB54|nr:RNA-binding protein 4.1-like isoform X3 [Denticeps clupeoides]XP_028808955.1 RNA-binding protein 4.1-like isoform X3 [Denticeps clupeoides]